MKNVTEKPGKTEHYIHSYDAAHAKQVVRRRTAESHAAFFFPHLCAGMSLLDCGCGPGAITVGLAGAVAPGEVVGLDIEKSQIDLARSNAATLQVSSNRSVPPFYERGECEQLRCRTSVSTEETFTTCLMRVAALMLCSAMRYSNI
ncbi:MAG: class I SAM-dependent methyltransferase [bacterium]|nr:class I SAM-dependent methyltransferase [bacterium]